MSGYSEDHTVYPRRPAAARLGDVDLSGVTYTRDRVQQMLQQGRTVQRVADVSTWPRAHVVRAGFEIGLRFDATSDVMTASGAGVQPAAPAPADLPPAPPARSPLAGLAELRAAITELRAQLGALESALAEVRAELDQRIHAREAAHQPPLPAPGPTARPYDSWANLDDAARAARVERLRARRDAYIARVDALGGPRVVVAWATAHGYADVRPQRIPDAVLDTMTWDLQVTS